jgi:oligopeptide/dipeptide ABC transporter ATP-binding protein
LATQVEPPLLEVKDLVKHFPIKGGSWFGSSNSVVRAVDGVSFSIGSGETLGLVGESGSGKSTTGRLVLRLLEATRGSCTFDGQNVFELSHNEMRDLRRSMQIVFQDPYGAFNPRMSVGSILGEALELRGNMTPAEWQAEIRRLLELVQLPANVGNRYPHEFSGGQRQRIGIARALAVEPKFIVADEPVSALDVSTQAEIVNLLLDLQKRLGLTMLFISHDLSVVRVLADRIAVMYGGKILELSTTASLFDHPLQPYTQELLTAIPEPDPTRAHREARTRGVESADASTPSTTGCPYAGRCPRTMDICKESMPEIVDYAPSLGEAEPHFAACFAVAQDFSSSQSQVPA